MCQLEDVYHSPCGHWADKPNIYHRCVKMRTQSEAEPQSHLPFVSSDSNSSTYSSDSFSTSFRPSYRTAVPCHDSHKSRSRTEYHQKCAKCTVNVDKIVSKQSGMWFSCYLDSITGKPKYKNRQGESQASKDARAGKPRRLNKAPPKQAGNSHARLDEEEEEETQRNNSWSSHGHVEL